MSVLNIELMANFQQIKVFDTMVKLAYVNPESNQVNEFLQFLGARVRDVQMTNHNKTGSMDFLVRYQSSDKYEVKVKEYFDNL
jgi:hypothetical protein